MAIGNYNILGETVCNSKSKDTILSPASGGQLVLAGATITQNTGGTIDVAIGYKFGNASWKAGQWTDATTTYTDDTTDAQSAATNDFALTTTTNNDGFIVQCVDRFNLVGMTIQTAQAGVPVYAFNYWNGSAWAAVPPGLQDTPSFTSGAGTDTYMSFHNPSNWEKSGTSAGTGLDPNMYAFRMRATTAPSTAPLASILWVGKWIAFKESLASLSSFSIDLENTQYVLPGGAVLMPYFATANANNTISAIYKTIGSVPA